MQFLVHTILKFLADGQAEQVNCILNEMLRHHTNSRPRYDDWDLQLPLCEFAHNNARNSATGMYMSPINIYAMASIH